MTNHMNEFFVLMQQWENVEKYIETADNASGQSMQKYEAYTDSIAGKIEGFKNSMQSLSTATLDSNLFKGIIDSGTGLLNIITQLIDVGGGIPALVGAIATFKSVTGSGKLNYDKFHVIVINAPLYKVA